MITPWKILSTFLAIGFLASPLIALTISPLAGLIVLALAITAVLYLAWHARDQVSTGIRPRLMRMIQLNLAALLATIAAIIAVALT